MCSFYHHLDHEAHCACHLISYTFSMHMRLHMYCNRYKHKSATPFWVAAGYVCMSMAKGMQYNIAVCALIGFHMCRYDQTFILQLLTQLV